MTYASELSATAGKPWNFIFFRGLHVLTLPAATDDREAAPSLFVEDDNRVLLNEMLLKLGDPLWNYGEGQEPLASRVERVKEGSSYGCEIPAHVEGGWHDVMSTQPIVGRDAGWREANLEEHMTGLGLLARRVLGQPGLSTRQMAEILSEAQVRSAQLATGEGRALVIESTVSWERASVGVLMVAEPGDGGEWQLTWVEINLGGANDSESAPRTSTVEGSADLDDDGVDELFVSSLAYESASLTVYKRVPGDWQALGFGAGGGC